MDLYGTRTSRNKQKNISYSISEAKYGQYGVLLQPNYPFLSRRIHEHIGLQTMIRHPIGSFS